jgi:para-nitrobenzyl esterase
LRWIQANIASFGGDPSRVTVVGQSAGADSIACLLAADETEGLFHQAILMSPPLKEIRDRIPTIDLLARQAMGLLTADPREMSTAELLDLQKAILINPVRPQIMPFGPALNHYPLPGESELNNRLNSRLAEIPILIGWTAHDGRPFARWMGPLRPLYNLPAVGWILESLGTWWVSRSYFAWPSEAFRKQVEDDAGGNATSYEFQWHPARSKLQANHCIDIPFILGRSDAWSGSPMLQGPGSKQELESLGQQMRSLYAGFIHGRRLRPGHLVIGRTFECSDNLWQ